MLWIAVIPACNEERAVDKALKSAWRAGIDKIILVANGCKDLTIQRALQSVPKELLTVLDFTEPLGIDVPRSAGASCAAASSPDGVLFIDGDMVGKLDRVILDLKKGVEEGLDLALTDCYPEQNRRQESASAILRERESLNRRLGLFGRIAAATPSHGPHAVSSRFLAAVPLLALAVPPLAMAIACRQGLSIGVAASIPHLRLESSQRDDSHSLLIAETIIGDCRLAAAYSGEEPLEDFLLTSVCGGYHPQRRLDILIEYLKYGLNSRGY